MPVPTDTSEIDELLAKARVDYKAVEELASKEPEFFENRLKPLRATTVDLTNLGSVMFGANALMVEKMDTASKAAKSFMDSKKEFDSKWAAFNLYATDPIFEPLAAAAQNMQDHFNNYYFASTQIRLYIGVLNTKLAQALQAESSRGVSLSTEQKAKLKEAFELFDKAQRIMASMKPLVEESK